MKYIPLYLVGVLITALLFCFWFPAHMGMAMNHVPNYEPRSDYGPFTFYTPLSISALTAYKYSYAIQQYQIDGCYSTLGKVFCMGSGNTGISYSWSP